MSELPDSVNLLHLKGYAFGLTNDPPPRPDFADAEIGARYDYLLRRRDDQNRGRLPRWWGMSSDSLVAYAIGWIPEPTWKPADRGDLDACEVAYERATPAMQERMLPVLVQWRDLIYSRHRR